MNDLWDPLPLLHWKMSPTEPKTDLLSIWFQSRAFGGLDGITLNIIGFPGDPTVWHLPAKAEVARDADSIPGSGRSPRKGNGNLILCSCLENPRDRGAWWLIVHRVKKSRTWLNTRWGALNFKGKGRSIRFFLYTCFFFFFFDPRISRVCVDRGHWQLTVCQLKGWWQQQWRTDKPFGEKDALLEVEPTYPEGIREITGGSW